MLLKGMIPCTILGKETEEKLNKLYVLEGSKPIRSVRTPCRRYWCHCQIKYSYHRRYTFHQEYPSFVWKTEFSVPYTYKRYKTVNKGDDDKVSQALSKMMQEDVTLKVVNDAHRTVRLCCMVLANILILL